VKHAAKAVDGSAKPHDRLAKAFAKLEVGVGGGKTYQEVAAERADR